MANGQLWYIDSNGVKHRLGGVVTGDLPSYTLEEYNALPVKPTYWIRLDADDNPIASNQISHGNGTVKDKLDSLDTSVSGISTRMTTAEGDIDTLETNLSNTFRTATSNNLIPMPYKDAHGTKNGITYDQIDNAEPGDLPGYGSYKINGTSSAYTELELTQTDIYLIPGTYRFQGGIGGSSSTYYLQVEVYNSRMAIDKFKNYSTFGQTWTTFTLSEKSRIKVKVIINSGVTVSNIPLFPILEHGPMVQSGYCDNNAGSDWIRSVTFPVPFSSVPSVTVTPFMAGSGSYKGYIRTCTITDITTTGFNFVELGVKDGTSSIIQGTDRCYWIASCQ